MVILKRVRILQTDRDRVLKSKIKLHICIIILIFYYRY